MNELIYILANKLSQLDDNDGEVFLSDREYDINESLFFVSGVINYTFEHDSGDFFTAPVSSRNFLYADLDVTVFVDKNDEEGRELNEIELFELYKALK